jgi:hypothetical protein
VGVLARSASAAWVARAAPSSPLQPSILAAAAGAAHPSMSAANDRPRLVVSCGPGPVSTAEASESAPESRSKAAEELRQAHVHAGRTCSMVRGRPDAASPQEAHVAEEDEQERLMWPKKTSKRGSCGRRRRAREAHVAEEDEQERSHVASLH